MNKRDRLRVEGARARLKTLCDVTDTSCTVPADAREAARIYIETWILPFLDAALRGGPDNGYMARDARSAIDRRAAHVARQHLTHSEDALRKA